jgi:hypothetical protein
VGVEKQKKFGIILEREREKEMRKPPKTETIRKKINAYSYRAGFTLHPQNDGTYSLFDIHMGYYVCRGSMDTVVRFVTDELWAKYFRTVRA